jgi:hypothetical protein
VSCTHKGSSKFVKKQDLPRVRKQLRNYGRMKLLMQRRIDLATQWSTLWSIKEIELNLGEKLSTAQSFTRRKPHIAAFHLVHLSAC